MKRFSHTKTLIIFSSIFTFGLCSGYLNQKSSYNNIKTDCLYENPVSENKETIKETMEYNETLSQPVEIKEIENITESIEEPDNTITELLDIKEEASDMHVNEESLELDKDKHDSSEEIKNEIENEIENTPTEIISNSKPKSEKESNKTPVSNNNTNNTNNSNKNNSASNSGDSQFTIVENPNNSTTTTPIKDNSNSTTNKKPETPSNDVQIKDESNSNQDKVENIPTSPSSVNFMKEVEDSILQKVNQTRAEYGLSALKDNSTAKKYARIKSQDMGDNNYFSHTNLKGETIFKIMVKDNVSFRKQGENLGYISSSKSVEYIASNLMNCWMQSQGHKDNILSKEYTHIGIGVYNINGEIYATQEFLQI